jgi:hypothetical protein
MVLQSRATATSRFSNFVTGPTPGRRFQSSTSPRSGHSRSNRRNSASEEKTKSKMVHSSRAFLSYASTHLMQIGDR